MEIVEHNDRVVALIFRPELNGKGTNFFTPPEFALQVGYKRYNPGDSIRAHSHPAGQRIVTGTAEIAIVQSGSCEVMLYSDEGTSLSTHTLNAGDAIVMVSGGHSLHMVKETILYLIKQGPYNAESDKNYL